MLSRAGALSRRPARARASLGIVLLHQSLGRRDGMGAPIQSAGGHSCRRSGASRGLLRQQKPGGRRRANGDPQDGRAQQGPEMGRPASAAARAQAGTGTLEVAACDNPSALPPPRASTTPAPPRGGRSTRPLQGLPDRGGEQLRPAPGAARQPPACVARPPSQEPSAASSARAFALISASYSRIAASRPLWNTSWMCWSASLRPLAVRR